MFPSVSWVAALAAVGALGGGLALHKDGPPPAHTGGFDEPTCGRCHDDAGLNEPGGTLDLAGVPDAYQPGRTYELTVSLRRPGMRRSGVQLAMRFAAGAARATQAGTLAPGDAATRVVRDSVTGVEYLGHTLAGTTAAADGARWVARWTAPADRGPGGARGSVVLHVAANAANDDDSPFGDFIYTRAVEVPRRQRRPRARGPRRASARPTPGSAECVSPACSEPSSFRARRCNDTMNQARSRAGSATSYSSRSIVVVRSPLRITCSGMKPPARGTREQRGAAASSRPSKSAALPANGSPKPTIRSVHARQRPTR